MQTALMHTGRILLGLYFFLPGIMKFADWDTHVTLMQTHSMSMIPVLLAIAGVTQIIGSLALFANKYVWQCALGFAVMVLLINFNLHDFWNFTDVKAQHETQNFVKNLGIFAGLLLLAGSNMPKQSVSEQG